MLKVKFKIIILIIFLVTILLVAFSYFFWTERIIINNDYYAGNLIEIGCSREELLKSRNTIPFDSDNTVHFENDSIMELNLNLISLKTGIKKEDLVGSGYYNFSWNSLNQYYLVFGIKDIDSTKLEMIFDKLKTELLHNNNYKFQDYYHSRQYSGIRMKYESINMYCYKLIEKSDDKYFMELVLKWNND